MPRCIITACGKCCGNICEFSCFMETDSVKNCVVGVAVKVDIQSGSQAMMAACGNCTATYVCTTLLRQS